LIENFLSDNGTDIIFNGEQLEAYIPEFYFKNNKLGEQLGSSLKVFGLFNIRMINKGKPSKLETFILPSMIMVFPSTIEYKKLKLIDEQEEEECYMVLNFFKGGKITPNSVSQDATNVELFLDLICGGKLPETIPYNQIIQIWQKNLNLNNINLNVTSTVLEVIVSEIYRNKKKPEETFAKLWGRNPNISQYEYKRANIREICARNSTFAALTYEDMDAMITSSLNIRNYNREETESPIEKIIKM